MGSGCRSRTAEVGTFARGISMAAMDHTILGEA